MMGNGLPISEGKLGLEFDKSAMFCCHLAEIPVLLHTYCISYHYIEMVVVCCRYYEKGQAHPFEVSVYGEDTGYSNNSHILSPNFRLKFEVVSDE